MTGRICLAKPGCRRRSRLSFPTRLLTYMSPRLNRLIDSGALSRVPVLLGPRDQVQRLLYWTKDLEEWSRKVCQEAQSRSLLTIPEQLNLVFSEFVSGRPMSSGLAKCDPPKGGGIWRLKTTDLRLYGWADAPHCMVLAKGELKKVLVAPGPPKDRHLGKQAVETRRSLRLSCAYGERYDLFPAIG